MDVLLVDDEEIIRRSLGEFMHRCGHQVRTAGDCVDALSEVENRPPDALITDIHMPGMSGLDLLEKIKARALPVPVVLITGYGDVDTAVGALKRGAYDYLRKPVKLEELVSILERIDERRSLEKRLLEERAKLAHADRMATVGTLAAGVAHEINNPITMIRGNLQTFQQLWERVGPELARLQAAGLGGPHLSLMAEEMPGMVASMLTGTERVTRIVNQIKLFSRTDDQAPAGRVKVADCVNEALLMVGGLLSGIKVVKDLAPGEVVGVGQEITQVFTNLIHNAIQALGGQEAGLIEIAMKADTPSWITVEVKDNGPGIPEQVVQRIFEPFFTTKEPGKGTGLGLSICHSIVSAHKGQIGFDAAPGGGTCFWVRLPRLG